ncbi:MAG: 3-hydroxyacyl-ACP dehydratase FabZ [Cytophagales bacterium]|nr:3-hydroxyacyl-ACP dehydratase FabZ [Cytophagales bacterium]
MRKDSLEIPLCKVTDPPLMGVGEIMNVVPHRPPFLFLDSVLELTDDCAVGIKHVSLSEPCLQGHFPKNPIMPGLLQVEAACQLGHVLASRQVENMSDYWFYLASCKNIRFKKQVVPGDTLLMKVTMVLAFRRGFMGLEWSAFVRGELVSFGEAVAGLSKKTS